MYDVGSSVETLSPWAILSVTVKFKRVVVNSLRVMRQKHSETNAHVQTSLFLTIFSCSLNKYVECRVNVVQMFIACDSLFASLSDQPISL